MSTSQQITGSNGQQVYSSNHYYGKYRGKVVNNIDPEFLGRLYVSVPSVLGSGVSVWALPCVPYAGPGVGFWAIPPVSANVWIEFEGGNLDYPIWTGCYWTRGKVPQAARGLPEFKVFQTESCSLQLSDVKGAGGVKLNVRSPAVPTPLSLSFNSKGIEITNQIGTVKLANEGITLTMGSSVVSVTALSVSINRGALEVI